MITAQQLLLLPSGSTPALAAACVASLACFLAYLLSRASSAKLFPAYRSFPLATKRDWDTRFGSTLHAVAITAVAAYIASTHQTYFFNAASEPEVPKLLRRSPETYAALGMSLGYFVVDLLLVVLYYPDLGGPAMVGHHVAATCSVITAIVTGNGHMLTLIMLSTEVTTPFVNLRWFLEQLALKASTLYKVNGVLIFLSWLVARILLFPPFFWMIWQERADIINRVHPFQQFLVVAVPLLLCGLNIMWFWKIVKGVIKLFAPKQPLQSKVDHKE